MFNLLHESWLPVRTASGALRRIAPYQIGDPDIAELAPGRADFKAALMEFLVGLMQTAFAPGSRDWKSRLDTPPSEAELRQAFQPHESFFELLGEREEGKGLFMQDLKMCNANKPKHVGIASLLIDQPGEKTLKDNTDLFVHRGQVNALCPACAAAALYTLQAFAPSGGQGHRTSLRGGGPLSTLLKGQNLWKSVWLNVLPCGPRPNEMPPAPLAAELAIRVYPWAAPTRASKVTHPEDMHLLHAYWGMPRRLLLEYELMETVCDICGEHGEIAVIGVRTLTYGYNYRDKYGSYWQHPLTPYSFQEGKAPESITGQNNSAAYSNWLGVVYGMPLEAGGKALDHVEPARCCRRSEARKEANGINAAGYNMSNMKAVSWCEHVFPIIDVPEDEEFRKAFIQTVSDMVQAADKAQSNLEKYLKMALFAEVGKKTAPKDKTLFTDAANAFWIGTEADFYRHIRQLSVQQPDGDDWRATLYSWGEKVLLPAVNRIYETVAWVGFSPERMEQRVTAQGLLNGATIKDLRNRVMYPPKQKEKKS